MSRLATATSLALLGLLGLVGAAPAAAQPAPKVEGPGFTPGPAVDVADLPPLPAGSDEVSSSATVLAASSAEEDVVVGAAKREIGRAHV